MCDINSLSNLLSGLIVGSFTLGGIWLKDHLDNKKLSQSTLRQRAIETYALTNQIMYSLNSMYVICKNLIADKKLDCQKIEHNYQNKSSDMLQKLELLIIENFYDLKPQFDEINEIIVSESMFLINIICGTHDEKIKLDESIFEKRREFFISTIVNASASLKNRLITNYINKKDNSIITSITTFFKKYISK